jgi:hypothetical protein
VSVALNKVKGITSVNVTLKRGVAHLALEPGNAVSLPHLRGIIKDAGYVSEDAVVVARGIVTAKNGEYVLEVTGTSTSVRLVPDPAAPDAFAELRKVVRESTRVEIVGTIESPSGTAKKSDTLRMRSFTIDP